MKFGWLVVVLCACGSLTPMRMDAGQGGGAGGGSEVVTGGGDGSTGGGVGGGGGGNEEIDAGTPDAGVIDAGVPDAGHTWTFSTISVNGTTSGSIAGIGENDAGVWAVSTTGRLFRSTGGGFNQVLELTKLTGERYQPSDFAITPSGRMFFLSSVWLGTCANDCETLANWNVTGISSASTSLKSLCVVDDNHVLLVGDVGNAFDGVAYRWNGSALSMTGVPLNVRLTGRCTKSLQGDFIIPADNAVVRYDPQFESFTPNTASPNASWRFAASVDGHEWIFAPGPRIAEANGNAWSESHYISGQNTIRAAFGVAPDLVWGFGGAMSTSATQKLWKFNGTNWSAVTPDLSGFYQVHTAFRARDGSIYFGGEASLLEVAMGRAVLR